MPHDAIKKALLASYALGGGINHLDGANLPSQDKVVELARDLMHLLFPGFFEDSGLTQAEAPAWLDQMLTKVEKRLSAEIEKCLRYAKDADAKAKAEKLTADFLSSLPEVRRVVQTDVAAAYTGDPAARSLDEIILAYPCVLAISLQRLAHVLYAQKVPLLPRMLTEYAHERTGIDIHPGAHIGEHFFIDHGTGVVVGETAIIGQHVKIYQGVTLGAKSFETDASGVPIKGIKRHPEIGDRVTIYAHATILGGDTVIGAHSVVGASVWLMHSIPPHSVAYYKDTSLIVRPRKAHELVLDGADWSI